MSLAKLNTTGLWWVTELADHNFTVKYQPGNTNVDVEILSRILLDMDKHTRDCAEEIHEDVIGVTLDEVRVQAKGTIPWVTAIAANTTAPEPT